MILNDSNCEISINFPISLHPYVERQGPTPQSKRDPLRGGTSPGLQEVARCTLAIGQRIAGVQCGRIGAEADGACEKRRNKWIL